MQNPLDSDSLEAAYVLMEQLKDPSFFYPSLAADEKRTAGYIDALKQERSPNPGWLADAVISRRTALASRSRHPHDRRIAEYAGMLEQHYAALRAFFPGAPE
ncbi:MAG: hypothetical protein HY517_03950 [Candidatus Aenigmarchaeota archaeon]|nr:hypothetical protein [Candidatus Aenigmarchaeota archaeon]